MAKKESKTNVPDRLQIPLPERIDTFNQERHLAEIQEALEKVRHEVILDLSLTRFISLPFIKKLAVLALDFRSQHKEIILLNGTEKIKKQINIFSNLEFFTVQRAFSKPEWPVRDVSADF